MKRMASTVAVAALVLGGTAYGSSGLSGGRADDEQAALREA